MAWTDLKAAVAAIVKTNGTKTITGALLQSTLCSIIDQVGENATFKGVAIPSTAPGTPDGVLFYIASSAGTYANFNGYIHDGLKLKIFLWNGIWTVIETGIAIGDLSQKADKYDSLSVSVYKKDQTGTNLEMMRSAILDLELNGVFNPAYKYFIAEAVWGNTGISSVLAIYSHNGSGWVSLVAVCVSPSTVLVQDASEPMFLNIVESGGSGITGGVTIQWNKLTQGVLYSGMQYEFVPEVFNTPARHIINRIYENKDYSDNLKEKELVVAQSKQVLAFDVPIIRWQHPRGESEMLGDTSQNISPELGICQQVDKDILFNSVQIPFILNAASTYEIRIYTSAAYSTNLNNWTLKNSVVATDANTYLKKGFLTHFLGTNLFIEKNLFVYIIAWKTAGAVNPIVLTFTNQSAAPLRKGLLWNYNSGTRVWNEAGDPGYKQASFRLMMLENDSTKYQVVETDGQLKNAYIKEIQYKHPRGDSEYLNVNFYNPITGANYSQVDSDVIFNTVRTSMWGAIDSVIEARLYTHTAKTANILALGTLVATKVFAKGEFNSIPNTLCKVMFDAPIKVTSGKWVYLVISDLSGSRINLGHLINQSEAAPFRNGFLFTGTPTPFSTMGLGSEPGYFCVPLQLSIENKAREDVNKENKDSLELSLPAIIPVAVGREFNLWYDCLGNTPDTDKSGYLKVYPPSSELITRKSRSLRITPTAGQIDTQIDINVSLLDRNYKETNIPGNNATTKIKVVSNTNGGGATKQILCVGDSLTELAYHSTELRTLFLADGGIVPSMIGTKGDGVNKHEGKSSQRWLDYTTNSQAGFELTVAGVTAAGMWSTYSQGANTWYIQNTWINAGSGYLTVIRLSGVDALTPSGILTKASGSGDAVINYSAVAAGSNNVFWDMATGKIDFVKYCTKHGFSGIDICPVQLGLNDVNQTNFNSPDFNSIIANAKVFIDALLNPVTGYPNCKVIVGCPPIGANTDAAAGSAARSSSELKRKMLTYNKMLIENFDNAKYHANVTVAANHLWVDRLNGYPSIMEAVSAREPGITEFKHLDAVHPKQSGNLQVADSFYSAIRNIL